MFTIILLLALCELCIIYVLPYKCYTFGVLGVVGRRRGPFDIVGVVRPVGVGVVLPPDVGVCRPDLVGVDFGVEVDLGTADEEDLGVVGVDRPNAVVG